MWTPRPLLPAFVTFSSWVVSKRQCGMVEGPWKGHSWAQILPLPQAWHLVGVVFRHLVGPFSLYSPHYERTEVICSFSDLFLFMPLSLMFYSDMCYFMCVYIIHPSISSHLYTYHLLSIIGLYLPIYLPIYPPICLPTYLFIFSSL